MKRIILLVLAFVLLLTSCGIGTSAEEQTLERFTEAMRIYDKQAMAELLTAFPDKSPYVYLDDIFNDAKYQELYRLLYTDITYAIKSTKNNRITAEFTMPNVQKLYANAAAMVTNLAFMDETLVDKLNENEENGIILIQELMLEMAKQDGKVETMEQEFTLSFAENNGKVVIVCDDELKALLTGNFFLSKNVKVPEDID